MDLSALSDDDFKALQAGNLAAMSDAGFAHLVKQQQAAKSPQERYADRAQIEAEKNSPEKGMSAPALLAAGIGKAPNDLYLGAKQLLGGATTADVEERRRLDAPLMSTTAGKVGNFAGSVGQFAPTALIPGANTVTGSGVIGALTGYVEPVAEGESRGLNALKGGLGGSAGAGVANGLSRVISPKPPIGAQPLINDGINLTVGQRLGGAWKRAEDAATSIPVAGDFIRNAQRRSFEDFNTAVANKALDPIGAKLPAGVTGRDAVAYVEKAIGDKYNNALAGIKTIQGDSQFGNEIASLQTMVHNSTLPQEVQKQFDQVVKSQIAGKFQGQNAMTAQTYKDAESELGRLATAYKGDASADKRLLGDAIEEAQASMRRLLERSAGPQYADEVKAANSAWAQFKRMQRASSSLGAEDGVFNPEQYLSAVKALTKDSDSAAFSRGGALNQKFADDAKRIMGRKVPDSGTPFRTLIGNPLQGAISAVPASLLAAPGIGPYSKSGQALYQALLTSKRPAIAAPTAEQLNALAPYLGLSGAYVANALEK